MSVKLLWKGSQKDEVEERNRVSSYRGYLYKLRRSKNLLAPQWGKRWITIEGHFLKWYRQETDLSASGMIDLKFIRNISKLDSTSQHAFEVNCEERTLVLRCQSKADMSNWVRALHIQADIARGGKGQSVVSDFNHIPPDFSAVRYGGSKTRKAAPTLSLEKELELTLQRLEQLEQQALASTDDFEEEAVEASDPRNRNNSKNHSNSSSNNSSSNGSSQDYVSGSNSSRRYGQLLREREESKSEHAQNHNTFSLNPAFSSNTAAVSALGNNSTSGGFAHGNNSATSSSSAPAPLPQRRGSGRGGGGGGGGGMKGRDPEDSYDSPPEDAPLPVRVPRTPQRGAAAAGWEREGSERGVGERRGEKGRGGKGEESPSSIEDISWEARSPRRAKQWQQQRRESSEGAGGWRERGGEERGDYSLPLSRVSEGREEALLCTESVEDEPNENEVRVLRGANAKAGGAGRGGGGAGGLAGVGPRSSLSKKNLKAAW